MRLLSSCQAKCGGSHLATIEKGQVDEGILSPDPKLVLLSWANASVYLKRKVVSTTWILFVYITVGYLLSPNAVL